MSSQHDVNVGEIAHIVAAKPNGPRGHPVDSKRLREAPANLILLCLAHHTVVDKRASEFPVELLGKYKAEQEERMERLGAIEANMATVPVVLQVPIFQHSQPIPAADIAMAIASERRYPEDRRRIEIDLLGLVSRDHDARFWSEARRVIRTRLESRMEALNSEGPVSHLSIFAAAPIPLLVEFGRLVGDKVPAHVFNWHRAPRGWVWPRDLRRASVFRTVTPRVPDGTLDVALVISVSSKIAASSFCAQLPTGVPVFEVKVDDPVPDRIRSPADVEKFSAVVRETMEAIHRSQAKTVHVFAAVPVALAVELGRSVLPKVHAAMVLYDFHQAAGGWKRAFEVGGNA